MTRTKSNFSMLLTLTLLFILAQIAIFSVHQYLTLEQITRTALSFPPLLVSKPLFFALCHFFLSQLLIYGLYLYWLWYISISLGELLVLEARGKKALSISLFLLSLIALLAANAYFVSHSLFASLIRHNLFQDKLNSHFYWLVTLITVALLSLALLLTVLRGILALCLQQNRLRHGLFYSLLLIIVLGAKIPAPFSDQTRAASAATAEKPNIIIIGLDAVRPDYLGFFNSAWAGHTPQLDHFLQAAMAFNEAYTPLGRTFPAWTSILSGQYPRHHGVIEDSIDTDNLNFAKALPQILKKSGYETIYASDDHRFSDINQQFGFEQIIGPDGKIADFVIGSLNDFPLSNLLISTAWGQKLFPYNFANHGSFMTYQWQNFITLLQQELPTKQDKPLFLAVHFNQTAWPFYWFNDQQGENLISAARYPKALQTADLMFGQFLDLLQQRGLLKHALVVLLSDHGISLALPGDRIAAEGRYQGDKSQIKLLRTPYAQTQKMALDTSYGYGSDVLSLKQYQSLLAFRTYGLDWGKPKRISGRASLIDLTPTLLDIMHLSSPASLDGRSLKPYLQAKNKRSIDPRPLFLESGYSVPEMHHDGIMINSVLKESIALFQIDQESGRVTVTSEALKRIMQPHKQFAVLEGNWMLAYYPASLRYKLARESKGYELKSYIAQPFLVLVNLKTGQWTTELNGEFAQNSALIGLRTKLAAFTGLKSL